VFLACAALAAYAPWRAAAGPAAEPDSRAARLGMTEAEVLAALPGKARRLAEPERLGDGNVVSLGIDEEPIGSTSFRVRFVFDAAGKLVAVSLRTDPERWHGPEVFAATRDAVAKALGAPAETSADRELIDMRQATWRTPGTRLDVKYIPGVVVVLRTPEPVDAEPAR
jgi:hypothetical protein